MRALPMLTSSRLARVATYVVLGALASLAGCTCGQSHDLRPGDTLVFVTQPQNATAGATLSGIDVEVHTAAGDPVVTDAAITLTLSGGPSGAVLGGTTTVAAVAGRAHFADLSVTRAAQGYSLHATATGADPVPSHPFNVLPAAAGTLAFVSQPHDVQAGATLSPAVTVEVRDAFGNRATASTPTISLAFGSNPGSASLAGTTTAQVANGFATFADLSIDKPGQGDTLTATSPGLSAATSTAFDVTAGAAHHLAFSVQPASARAGAPLVPSVQVSIVDATGNLLAAATDVVTLTLSTNPSGAVLGGTLSVGAVGGVAVFNDLSLDRTGQGFALSASSGSLVGAVSNLFDITPGNATHLAFTVQPSTAEAGAALVPAVEVSALDALGNLDTAFAGQVDLATASGPGAIGTVSAQAQAGVASFPTLAITQAGTGYSLGAAASGLGTATSALFDILPATTSTRARFAVQPTGGTAGTALAPAIQVELVDAFGNRLNSSASVTLAFGNNPSGAVLGGTTTVAASAGLATFANLTVDRPGAGFTLQATAPSVTAATSSGFDIAAGAADHLAFAVQPSNVASGSAIAPAVQVSVLDSIGNLVTTSSASITLALGSNPGGAALTGNVSAAAVNGVATFSNLRLDKAGAGYTLVASTGALPQATSSTFAVTAGSAAQLVFTAPPTDAASGSAISPAVQVTVEDAAGNPITNSTASITVALGTNPSSGTLSGTQTVSAVSGVATFTTLSIDKAGAGYTLMATSGALSPSTSAGFNIIAGAAAKLAFVGQPSTVASAAAIAPAVQVAVEDAAGNTVTSSSASITVALGTNPSGGTLGGTQVVSAVNGLASFSTLTVDKAGTGYTLAATAASLTGAGSSAFDVTAGAADHLAFSVQPSSAVSGAAIAPAIRVAVVDAAGNTVTPSTASITLALGTNPSLGILSGTVTQAASGGVASFANLSVDKAGSGYTLVASAASLTGAVSSGFDISAGPADHLVFSEQPSNLASGASFAPAVAVSVVDVGGNTVVGSSASITVALGTNPSSGTLGGTKTVSAVGGVATFGSLTVDKVGIGYTLSASASSLGGATSAPFDVSAGAANHLAFSVQPTSAASGAALAPAVQVSVQDAASNTVTTSTASITIAIGTNPAGGTLGGTKVVSAVNGIASFSTLTLDKAGTGYTLAATSAGLTAATSSAFNVTFGAADHLAFTVQPSNVSATVAVAPAIKVAVQDAAGNTVTNSTASIALAIGTNPSGAVLSGGGATSAVGGVATFSAVSLDKVGTGYTLSASSAGLTGTTSSAFNITSGPADHLAITVQPSNVASGVAVAPAVQVTVQDAANNTVTTSTASITMAIGTNPASGTLGGTKVVSAVSGIASFSTLTLDKVGTGYTLSASASGLTGATSSAFNVTFGSADHLAFSVQPSNVASGAAIAPAVTVTVQDAASNTVTSSTATITVAIGTNPASGTLGGTKVVSAVSGIASFSTLTVDKAGTGYTLTAAASGLTGATSSAFNVTFGAADHLAFSVQPSNVASGAAINPAVGVAVVDLAGNTVTSSTASITVAIGTNPASGTLGGTQVVSAVSGVASFSTLTVDKAGTGYTLSASATGLTAAASSAFNVTAGAANHLAFTVQPSNVASGAAVAPAVQVTVQDAANNTVTGSTASITMAIGTNPASGTLGGTKVVSAVGGIASFSTLTLDKVGTGYTLAASATGLTAATSSAFNVTFGSADHLAFSVQPSNATAGAAIAPAVQVTVQDAANNTVTTSTASITVAIGTNPASGTLGGTKVVSAVSGIASFSTLTVDKAGTGYTLSATATGLTAATSSGFNITAGTASALAFQVQPSNAAVNTAFAPTVTVAIVDGFGNQTASTATVSMGFGNNPSSATLGGTTSTAASAGVATFTGLSVSAVGTGYTLRASAAGLGTVDSSAFNVTSASGLAYTDPGSSGKIRLVRNAASTSSTVVLDLVTLVPLTGYSVAMNLPLDTTRAQANATLFTAGTVLNPGSSPIAAMGKLPASGPLSGVLVTGQSQKAAGTGAVATDTAIPAGSVLYTVRIDLKAGAPAGNVFNGASLGTKFRAALRDRLGNDVAVGTDVQIGRLDVL